MTDGMEQAPAPDSGERARRGSALGYGMAPVLAAGVLTAVMAGGLIGGGVAMASTLADGSTGKPVATATAPVSDPSDPSDPSTTDPEGGGSTQNPTSSPDRGSDQGEESDHKNKENDSDQESTGGQDQQTQRKDEIYIVQWGDTLTSISAKYGISVDMLAEYNHIRDVNLIYADSAMLVPYSQLNIPAQPDR